VILIIIKVDNPQFKNSEHGIVLPKNQTSKSKAMMNRATFLKIAGGTLIVGGIGYMLSDKKNFIIENKMPSLINSFLQPDERASIFMILQKLLKHIKLFIILLRHSIAIKLRYNIVHTIFNNIHPTIWIIIVHR
jgi:hypothetical protein